MLTLQRAEDDDGTSRIMFYELAVHNCSNNFSQWMHKLFSAL